MASLTYRKLKILAILLLILSLFGFSPYCLIAYADSSVIKITYVQTALDNNQSTFFFHRGVDVVGFNIAVTNTGSSIASGQLIVSMVDSVNMPIGQVTSPIFSLNPGETKTIQVFSDQLPNYAYVGIANATIVLEDTSLGPVCFQMASFYIYDFSTIIIAPSTALVIAGDSISYTATTFDAAHNSVDITSWVNWSTSNNAEGFWTGNTYSSAKAGNWNVIASLGSLNSTSLLNVNHGSAASIALSPQGSVLLAGQSQNFTTYAYDIFRNGWDITNSSNLSIDSAAGGSLIGNTYTCAKSGIWNVTSVYGDFGDTALLFVDHNSAVNLAIYPKNVTLTAGLSQLFNSSGTDAYGNNWDSTNTTFFIINSAAGGSWTGNVYECAKAGTWMVTATLDGASDTAVLTVIHGPINSIDVSPDSVNLTAGCSQAYNATAYDSYENPWDLTNSASFNIDPGAAGIWTANNYTSQNIGNWTVTAIDKDSNLLGTSQLAVYYPIDYNHDWKVNFRDLEDFVISYIDFNQNHIFSQAYDLNHDGRINFTDLEVFVKDYITYSQTIS